jgi:hypothetical protein
MIFIPALLQNFTSVCILEKNRGITVVKIILFIMIPNRNKIYSSFLALSGAHRQEGCYEILYTRFTLFSLLLTRQTSAKKQYKRKQKIRLC